MVLGFVYYIWWVSRAPTRLILLSDYNELHVNRARSAHSLHSREHNQGGCTVDRPFNKPGLSPEEFLRIVAHEDTLSQSLQRRAAAPAPPFITLRIPDPHCYKFMALCSWLKEFVIKEGVSNNKR